MGLFGKETRPRESAPTPPDRHPSTRESGTLIAENTTLKGEIGGSGDVRIEGRFLGSIVVTGFVHVAPGGRVEADVRGARVLVSGRVTGDISADTLVELDADAVVDGSLVAPKILIREGASLRGSVKMASPSEKPGQPAGKPGKSPKRHGRKVRKTADAGPEDSSPNPDQPK